MRQTVAAVLALLAALAAGCARMPASGPSRQEVVQSVPPGASTIQIVELDDAIARRLFEQRRQATFAEAFGVPAAGAQRVGAGDSIEIAIWEAPPATLFATNQPEVRGTSSGARPTVLPEQVVSEEGTITVPFAGKVAAAGQSLRAIEAEIARRLKGKANQPEIIARLTRHPSATVTVVGEFANSTRMPITPSNETLLDAVAAAGGVRHPVGKVSLQVTRGKSTHTMALDAVIRDPRQNIRLQPGDVVTAVFQPLSFTALGATGKNEEVPFEAQGISLAQALARAGGLQDARADAKGVFLFRFEPAGALDWPRHPVAQTPDGQVPVVYRLDLNNPASFFVMQSFALNNKDLLYVSNAPAAELQKVLNLVFSVAYPLLSAVQVTR